MKIVKFSEVQKMVGLSKSTIKRLEKLGKFPSRIRLGEKSTGWKETEIIQWINERPTVSSSK